MKSICSFLFWLSISALFANDINLEADSAHAPFYYGVASGDPMADKVIIWTHISSTLVTETVSYEVSLDSTFNNLMSNGIFITNDSLDYTVKIDVGGLSPNTIYYYRFKDTNNNVSAFGRTRTAPINSVRVNDLKFAVISCSSIYSGYYNSYRNIAARNDLHAVIHLGDYIYEDRVPNEEVRFPDNPPALPQNIEDWRAIHKFFLLDPDLRAARQQHPFIQLWDNHDTDGRHFECLESSEAFMNWTPVRVNPDNYQKIYRQLKYGDLVDIFILDVALWRGIDLISGTEYSNLGTEQFNWFNNAIQNSTAQWKVVGSQKMFSHWAIPSYEIFFGNPGGVLNLNSWDGYPSERERVLNVISNNNIDNVVIISGDMHVSLAADIPYEPTNPTSYIDSTGEGSICVEFAPPSISRGNFDEKGLQESFVNTVFEISNRENPNHQYLQLTKHGYGIMHFNNDSLKAQYWYCDILEKSNLDTLGKELILFNTENHWKRKEFTPTSIQEISHENGNVFLSKLYPNPAQQEVGFDIVVKKPTDINMSIYHMVSYKEFNIKSSNTTHIVKKEKVKVPIQHLPAGMYLLMIESTDFYKGQLFLKTE